MFTAPKIIFKKTSEDAVLPYKDVVASGGYFLKAVETKIVTDGASVDVDTGLSVEDFTKGIWAMVTAANPKMIENGIQPINQVIDNDFRGDLKIKLYNISNKSYLINKGDVIAKLFYFPLLTIEPQFNNE